LWRSPEKKLFHMSRETSRFETREIYNDALWERWGEPASLEDYLVKAQLMDYEATRAQFEAYTAMWSAERPATGLVYWMLNNAWPSLHWNLWDYYMRPAGSFFGAKTASRMEHVSFDYVRKAVWLVNRSLNKQGKRTVEVEVMDVRGKVLHKEKLTPTTEPNTSKNIASLAETFGSVTEPVFLRLVLRDAGGCGKALSRNVYWVAKENDVLEWQNSTWYYTPVSKYSDYKALNDLAPARVKVHADRKRDDVKVVLENKSKVPAFFVSLNLVDRNGNDVLPVTWDDNYVTLWPGEKLALKASKVGRGRWEPSNVVVQGKNVKTVKERL
jgi:exo-1,4-beta-D-glucosaminidase